jgi:hypothetical protein
MYLDNKEAGEHPHTDEILIVNMLILADWHRLLDYEGEFPATDRLSFRHFLWYLKTPQNLIISPVLLLFRFKIQGMIS